ncbi:Carboxylic acid reductase [Labeo rohita]|uniref:Carboxylic acid reductase n=1 Tax=Labeo rohita TaxID=84645 RepID=A0ABQ8L8Y9_LABRO|nr:Carboxylic acid reductase [Labeo rohita]
MYLGLRCFWERSPGQLTPQEDHAITKPESGLPPEKIKEMVDWMKVHKYPVSDVEGYMKETAIYRGEWIRSNLEGIPQASRQSWHDLNPVKHLCGILDQPSDNSQCSTLRSDLIIIQSVWNDTKNHNKLGQTKSRRTVATSPRCFKKPTCQATWKNYAQVHVGTNMVEYLQNAETSDIFLHVLCLGNESTTSQTFTIVSGHAIETESLLEAVDLCFKSFFVLDVHYTKQCLPTWEFLQHAVYHIDGHESSCVKFLRASVFSGQL